LGAQEQDWNINKASTLIIGSYPRRELCFGDSDKLFVLDGLPIEKKEEFLKKIRRKKIEEIIEIDEQSGVLLYGSLGAYGVIIVNTKK